MHYTRWLRHGDVQALRGGRADTDFTEWLADRVEGQVPGHPRMRPIAVGMNDPDDPEVRAEREPADFALIAAAPDLLAQALTLLAEKDAEIGEVRFLEAGWREGQLRAQAEADRLRAALAASAAQVAAVRELAERQLGEWMTQPPAATLLARRVIAAVTNAKLWCRTCQCRHVPNIPRGTWACADCGFGAWRDDTATEHATLFPEHVVYLRAHDMTGMCGAPNSDCSCSLPLDHDGSHRCEHGPFTVAALSDTDPKGAGE